MRTIDQIITDVNSRYGAPMGRRNIGTRPLNVRVYDCFVPMSDGCYDRGGAYWGIGTPLRVAYTKDLSYVEFYRDNERKLGLDWEHIEENTWQTQNPDKDEDYAIQCDEDGVTLFVFDANLPTEDMDALIWGAEYPTLREAQLAAELN